MPETTGRTSGGMPGHWQEFVLCAIFHFAIPLLPFGMERVLSGHITPETLSVGAAVYVMALGASSRNKALLGISILLGLVYISLFSVLKGGVKPVGLDATSVVWWTMLGFVVIHLAERYYRHVVER